MIKQLFQLFILLLIVGMLLLHLHVAAHRGLYLPTMRREVFFEIVHTC